MMMVLLGWLVWIVYNLMYYGLLVLTVLQLIRLAMADADLTLLFKEKYGLKTESLSGQVVWITGASSGIGEYLAYTLSRAGCRLILSARREDELNRVKTQCLLSGKVKEEDIFVLPFDLKDFDQHNSLAKQAIDKFGHLDILVNNGARSQRALIIDTSLEVDRDMFELVVLAQVSLTKAVLPHFMERKRGHVVVTSSVAGKLGAPMSATYTACKHAVQGFFEALRLEHSKDNIDVSLVCPGPVFSNITKYAYTGTLEKEHGVAMQPADRRVATDRCADLMGVAIANKLGEVWISNHPVLIFTYVAQYMPDVSRFIGKKVGMKFATRAREGR